MAFHAGMVVQDPRGCPAIRETEKRLRQHGTLTPITPLYLHVPAFSIIVPVYRSGPFLRDCLDSIRNQTLTDWECICINDGSPDDSGAILDEYARKDARFTAIHQENRGVSAARNAGLSLARGNWTAFVDGDDTVEPDMLACLHEETLRAQEAALLCYGISKDFHAGSRLIRTETTLPSRNQHIPAGKRGLSCATC